jgi:hypothetical protein
MLTLEQFKEAYEAKRDFGSYSLRTGHSVFADAITKNGHEVAVVTDDCNGDAAGDLVYGANTLPQALDTIHTLADALREAVGALRQVRDTDLQWLRDRAVATLASIESKVPREWLDRAVKKADPPCRIHTSSGS